MDQFVKNFLSNSDEAHRKNIIDEAQKLVESFKEDEVKSTRASVYIKTFQKMLEKGDDFVNSELKRVETLLDGKVSDKKKVQLRDRSNILTSFQLNMKDEL